MIAYKLLGILFEKKQINANIRALPYGALKLYIFKRVTLSEEGFLGPYFVKA
jgi:hypothetical protein